MNANMMIEKQKYSIVGTAVNVVNNKRTGNSIADLPLYPQSR